MKSHIFPVCSWPFPSPEDRLTWPWWQLADDEELLLEAPTALPRDALLALVLMDEVRKADGNVGEDGARGAWGKWILGKSGWGHSKRK